MTAEGLASLIGCHASTIRERKRFLLGNGGKYSNLGAPLAADRIDWANADWSKSNQSLAQEYGVSDEAARKQRKKYQN